jgi:hypothetical protein
MESPKASSSQISSAQKRRRSPDAYGEAEEVKRGAARCRMAFAVRPFAAKVDEPRLVGMEGESIPGKALAEDRLDPLGIGGCSMGMMDFTDFWKLRVYARQSCNETTDLPSFITLIR